MGRRSIVLWCIAIIAFTSILYVTWPSPNEIELSTFQTEEGPKMVTGTPRSSEDSCSAMDLTYPLSPLEEELRRIWKVTRTVMDEMNVSYWPTDGTLLGLMRNGRVATDRDLDFQIETTVGDCKSLLGSLRAHFLKYCKLKSFKVVSVKHHGQKFGRYAMVRMFREFGTFDTGVDFNCVYRGDNDDRSFFTHKGVWTPVPAEVYPLKQCRIYDDVVPCPADGMLILDALRPRYEGCMLYPHCLGNPTVSSKACLCPHPRVPQSYFIESTKRVATCGFISLINHIHHPACVEMMKGNLTSRGVCRTIEGESICIIQKFNG